MSNKIKLSDRTKQCKTRKTIFSILHYLCLFGPFLYFIPYGYATGEIAQKICMSFTVILSVILAFISMVISVSHKAGLHRCIMWTLIAGVLFCLQEIKVFIYIMTITSILDELLFVNLREHYKLLTKTNKEIDRRQ